MVITGIIFMNRSWLRSVTCKFTFLLAGESESNALGRKRLVGSPRHDSQPLSTLRKGGEAW